MVRLDWEIESDRESKSNYQEDAQEQRKRARQLLRMFVVAAVILALIVLAVYLVTQRVQQINEWEARLLSQTVQAEVAALRIGNQQAFMDLQRSASSDWLESQAALYEAYQSRKLTSDIQFTGNVLDVEIDGSRGRVQVEEIEQGTPYVNTWFYWHYDAEADDESSGGWYHVPADYTFWGEPQTLERDSFVVRYQSLDETFAQQLADKFAAWLQSACDVLTCGELPLITVDIMPNNLAAMRWTDGDAWQLVVPSPYVTRARSDMPFDTNRQIEAATLLAERLVQHVSPNEAQYPRDIYEIRASVASWLVGQFVQMNTNAHLIASIAEQYGPQMVGRIVNEMPADANMDALAGILGVADLSQANLDWRDLLSWRLVTEDEIIARGDEAAWSALYDFSSEAVIADAYARYNANQPPENYVVTSTSPQTGPNGEPELLATVYIGENDVYREEKVLFRLVNNVWLRAS